VRPNPSFEARPNGKPPGPARWYAYIFTGPGLASCRRSRLNSNVRPRKTPRAVPQQNQPLSAWTEQPLRGGPAGDRAPYQSTRYRQSLRPDRKAQRREAHGRNNAGTAHEGRAASEHPAAWKVMAFRLQSARSAAVASSGASAKSRVEGANACRTTVASARAGTRRSGHQKVRSRRRSRLSRAERGLTPRSRRGPTASHQARATGTVYIFRGPGLASYRWSRLNSNVRPRKTRRAVLQQNQRLPAWTEQPRRGSPTGDRASYQSTRYRQSLRPDRKAQRRKARGRNNAGTALEGRATSEHPAAWKAIAFTLQSTRSAAVSSSGASAKSRVEVARMRAAPPSRARSRNAPCGAPESAKSSQVQAVARRARPNPSFEARPNGVAPGPRSRKAYHRPRGPGATPLVPPQLER